MSQITSAFSGGGSGGSSSSSSLVDDAISGSNIMGDTSGAATLGGTSGGSFSDVVNALSGLGGVTGAVTPQAAQALSTNPPGSGPNPAGASGGTQSATSPGQGPPQQNQQQQQAAPQANQSAASSPDIASQLRDLLEKLEGKPKGPTGLVPDPGLPTPAQFGGKTGVLPPGNENLPEDRSKLGDFIRQAIGAPPAQPRVPPDQTGRDITVQPRPVQAAAGGYQPEGDPSSTAPLDPEAQAGGPGAGAGSQPPVVADQPGPPTNLSPPAPQAPYSPGQSRLIQDIAGISHGNPMSLLDLAVNLAPLLMLAGGGGKRVGMGGQHVSGFGSAPPGDTHEELNQIQDTYADLTGRRRQNALSFDKNGNPAQGGPFSRTGAFIGSPTGTPSSNQWPGVDAKAADAMVRQAAQKYGVDPNDASRMVGAESAYGQNNYGDWTGGAPGKGQPTSFGPLQLHVTGPGGTAMGDQFINDTGHDPRNPKYWPETIDYAMKKAAQGGWTPWTTSMNKLGMGRWSGINRHVAEGSISPYASDPRSAFVPQGFRSASP
jgi:hypothetical protein